MRLYQIADYPLRVYLEEDNKGELTKLIASLDDKYAPPDNTYITNMEDELDSIIFYDENKGLHYIVRGLLNIILKEAYSIGISCNNEVSDIDFSIKYPEISPDILEGISLRRYQLEGISAALAYHKGIIQVHTGGGKTEMMIGVSRYLFDSTDMNILLCVPTTNLLYQTYDRMIKRGIDEHDISLLGDGNTIDPTRRILVSTVQSAYKRLDNSTEYMEWLSKVDCLMMDEAHHSKCRTWSTLIDRVSPEYLLGFTAEPFHKDKSHMVSDLVLRGLIGPVIHRVTMDYLVEHGYLAKPFVVAVDTNYKGNIYKVIDWSIVNKSCIVKNTLRNELIRDVSIILINENKKPLILVQQIAHGQELAKLISKAGYSVYMMTGGRTISVFLDGNNIDKYVDNDNQVIKDFNDGKIDALIGTSTLDEGVDIPSLSAVILAGGGKGRLKVVQRLGRALRPKAGDNTAIIVDFRDRFNVVTHSHFKKRKALYDEMGMPVYYIPDIEGIKLVMQEFSAASNSANN
jgi:superfamily II DNA or RNA helicase